MAVLSSGDRKHSTIREELSPLEICRSSVSRPRVRAANPSRCSRRQDFARKYNHASVTARDRLAARDVHAHRSRDAIAANAKINLKICRLLSLLSFLIIIYFTLFTFGETHRFSRRTPALRRGTPSAVAAHGGIRG